MEPIVQYTVDGIRSSTDDPRVNVEDQIHTSCGRFRVVEVKDGVVKWRGWAGHGGNHVSNEMPVDEWLAWAADPNGYKVRMTGRPPVGFFWPKLNDACAKGKR